MTLKDVCSMIETYKKVSNLIGQNDNGEIIGRVLFEYADDLVSPKQVDWDFFIEFEENYADLCKVVREAFNDHSIPMEIADVALITSDYELLKKVTLCPYVVKVGETMLNLYLSAYVCIVKV